LQKETIDENFTILKVIHNLIAFGQSGLLRASLIPTGINLV